MGKKHIAVVFVSAMTVFGLIGCANTTNQSNKATTQDEMQQSGKVEDKQDDSVLAVDTETEFVESSESDPQEINSEEASLQAFSYKDLAKREFYFSSGAGAWNTTFTINEDGSFSGQYHDSDMGSIGEGYPNGTLYQCFFDGKFGELEKVDDLTYRTTIVEIHYEKTPGTDEIVNDMYMVYSEPYGLENSAVFEFYLPGKKVSDLSGEYVGWIYSDLYDYETQEMATELPFYGFCNVEQQYGFSSYNVVENYREGLKYTEEYAESLEKSIENDDLTQVQYNDKAKELYDTWDWELNSLWRLLKEELPQEKMDTLTIEQREWVKEKEEAVKKVAQQYEGGSMQLMQENLEAARLTKERLYELLKLLN